MKPIKYKRALVTGGAGFIGSHIVDALVKSGCDVRVLDNLSTGNLSNLSEVKQKITFCKGDIRDKDRLSKLTDGCDVIFHQAAVVSVPQTVADPIETAGVNEFGTLYILETARKMNIRRVVIAGSCAVYGNDPQLPKHETLLPSPESPYALQKLNGEGYAHLYSRLYGVETVCLRYFNVYGPRQDPSSPYSGVISIFINKATMGESPDIHGDGQQSRDFVFVNDVVRANLLAAQADGVSGEYINVGTGNSVTINMLWESICKISGYHAKPRYTQARPGDVIDSIAGTEHATSALGFKPEYSFEKGLEMTLKWYKEMIKTAGGSICN